jgi:hypothetical protein
VPSLATEVSQWYGMSRWQLSNEAILLCRVC